MWSAAAPLLSCSSIGENALANVLELCDLFTRLQTLNFKNCSCVAMVHSLSAILRNHIFELHDLADLYPLQIDFENRRPVPASREHLRNAKKSTKKAISIDEKNYRCLAADRSTFLIYSNQRSIFSAREFWNGLSNNLKKLDSALAIAKLRISYFNFPLARSFDGPSPTSLNLWHEQLPFISLRTRWSTRCKG